MPLILNKPEVKKQEQQNSFVFIPRSQETVIEPVVLTTPIPKPVLDIPDPIIDNDPKPILNNISPDEHILVVNGKQKKISKKSSYLLDMLIIDNE